MITATHLAERLVLIPLLSFILVLTSNCSDVKTEEKQENTLPASPPPVKPVAPVQEDTTRITPPDSTNQDTIRKPARMMNYKSFRKSYGLHNKGFIVGLFSKLYKA